MLSLLLIPLLFAHAEDVLWNKSEQLHLCNLADPNLPACGSDWQKSGKAANCNTVSHYTSACVTRLHNPNITIKYHTQVTDDAGTPVSCGSTIPAGTKLNLSFVPHTYEDVYWFGSGGSWDSPYGDWYANAEPPPITFEDKDYAGKVCSGGWQCSSNYSNPTWIWEKLQGSSLFRQYYPTSWALASEQSGTANFYARQAGGESFYEAYFPLSVNPPDKSLSGIDGFNCDAAEANGSRTCTPLQGGTFTPTFEFAATYGKFYWRLVGSHYGNGIADNVPLSTFTSPDPYFGFYPNIDNGTPQPDLAGSVIGDTYKLQVPAQFIQCPITVLPPIGNPPITPTLSSVGSCVVGTAHSINVQSTDPDGDNLKYGIDWDANGIIDQWVPPTGYVPSGGLQTASRTYAISGSKTAKALAQDENGNLSGWASLTFKCAGSATVGLDEGDSGNGDEGGSGNPTQLLPDIDLRVIPSLVKSGNTTKVNWSSVNVASCTVAAQNGDNWNALKSALGGNVSKPITAETVYTLTCLDLNGGTLTKTAKVRIIPTFEEK